MDLIGNFSGFTDFLLYKSYRHRLIPGIQEGCKSCDDRDVQSSPRLKLRIINPAKVGYVVWNIF